MEKIYVFKVTVHNFDLEIEDWVDIGNINLDGCPEKSYTFHVKGDNSYDASKYLRERIYSLPMVTLYLQIKGATESYLDITISLVDTIYSFL